MQSAYHLNDNYSNQNENFFNETDGEEADDEFEQFTTTAEIAYQQSFLSVPRVRIYFTCLAFIFNLIHFRAAKNLDAVVE